LAPTLLINMEDSQPPPVSEAAQQPEQSEEECTTSADEQENTASDKQEEADEQPPEESGASRYTIGKAKTVGEDGVVREVNTTVSTANAPTNKPGMNRNYEEQPTSPTSQQKHKIAFSFALPAAFPANFQPSFPVDMKRWIHSDNYRQFVVEKFISEQRKQSRENAAAVGREKQKRKLKKQERRKVRNGNRFAQTTASARPFTTAKGLNSASFDQQWSQLTAPNTSEGNSMFHEEDAIRWFHPREVTAAQNWEQWNGGQQFNIPMKTHKSKTAPTFASLLNSLNEPATRQMSPNTLLESLMRGDFPLGNSRLLSKQEARRRREEKREKLLMREKEWNPPNGLTDIPKYESVEDVHCGHVTSHLFYQQCLKTRDIHPFQRHLLETRYRKKCNLDNHVASSAAKQRAHILAQRRFDHLATPKEYSDKHAPRTAEANHAFDMGHHTSYNSLEPVLSSLSPTNQPNSAYHLAPLAPTTAPISYPKFSPSTSNGARTTRFSAKGQKPSLKRYNHTAGSMRQGSSTARVRKNNRTYAERNDSDTENFPAPPVTSTITRAPSAEARRYDFDSVECGQSSVEPHTPSLQNVTSHTKSKPPSRQTSQLPQQRHPKTPPQPKSKSKNTNSNKGKSPNSPKLPAKLDHVNSPNEKIVSIRQIVREENEAAGADMSVNYDFSSIPGAFDYTEKKKPPEPQAQPRRGCDWSAKVYDTGQIASVRDEVRREMNTNTDGSNSKSELNANKDGSNSKSASGSNSASILDEQMATVKNKLQEVQASGRKDNAVVEAAETNYCRVADSVEAHMSAPIEEDNFDNEY